MASAIDVDTVIVGAGAAGGVLATRLSEDPERSVLLLEAGPDFGSRPQDQPVDVVDAANIGPTAYDWGLEAALGAVGRRSPVFAGRLVGGSSATNNAFALRGHPADYDGWTAAGNPGWSYSDMLDAFVRVEHDLDFGGQPGHGLTGPVPIRRHSRGELPEHQQAFLDACTVAGYPSVETIMLVARWGPGRCP